MVIICVKNGVLLLFCLSRFTMFVILSTYLNFLTAEMYVLNIQKFILSIFDHFEHLSEPKDRQLTEILSRISRFANDSQIRSGGIQEISS